MTKVDETLEDVARHAAAAPDHGPLLYVVLEADRPLARGARYSLVGVEHVVIGRGEARSAARSRDGRVLTVSVPGRWISSSHLEISAVAGRWIAADADSRNGTYVNGERVTSRLLGARDLVEAGRVFFAVHGAPVADGPVVRDEDAERSSKPVGFRTLMPPLADALGALRRVARSQAVSVLLLGPTGSGKEVLAREVHALSGRAGPFVPVNCGALPETLVESLLFGHARGAFSGAARDEVGFIRAAEGGTLFLDEIGDLPAASQAALLRVLQEREVVPVGSTRGTRVDVRVLAATHRSLDGELAGAGFRSDLLARLKGYAHRLPPLSDRMVDFGVVLADVLASVAGDSASHYTLDPLAARAMLAYAWPLNIRELHQAMTSAVALAAGEGDAMRTIEVAHLPAELLAPPRPRAAPEATTDPDEPLRARIVSLLHEHGGNVAAVARAMGKAPAQIHRWMKRLELDPDVYRGP